MKTKKLIKKFPHEIIAVDEVGRGPLVGAVVIGAVRVLVKDQGSYYQLLESLKAIGINDSKKLSVLKRSKVLAELKMSLGDYRRVDSVVVSGIKLSFVTWEMNHEVIDEENILGASLRGMKEAALFLSKSKKYLTTLLIDGNKNLRWDKDKSPFIEIPLVQGDSKSLLIGLASIIAKEKRDETMRELHELYPQYGFKKNAGYPTKDHREAIRIHGPCPFHRKTFKGVKEFLGT